MTYLIKLEPAWGIDSEARITQLNDALLEVEYTLIPHGLHVVGQAPTPTERVDLLLSCAEASHDLRPDRAVIEALVAGRTPEAALAVSPTHYPNPDALAKTLTMLRELTVADKLMSEDHEIGGILHVLDGKFPSPCSGRRSAAYAVDSPDGPQPARV